MTAPVTPAVDDELDPDLEENETDDNETTEDEWQAPTQAEWNKLQRQLKRANAQAAKARTEQQIAPSADDVEAAKAAARAEAEEAFKTRLVKSEAKAKLAQAGAQGNVARLISLIDLGDIDVTDDDELDGLDDQIEALKEEFPQLFDTKKAPVKANPKTRADAAPKTDAPSPKSSADKLAEWMRTGKRPADA